MPDAPFAVLDPAQLRRIEALHNGFLYQHVYRLTRLLPRPIVMELIATAAQLDADRAAQLGLINKVTPNGGALDAALDLADRICANAPLAVRESLGIARQSLDLSDSELMMLSLEVQERLGSTEDFHEGPRAFLEKRAPPWSGL